jgi:hypothetical protein
VKRKGTMNPAGQPCPDRVCAAWFPGNPTVLIAADDPDAKRAVSRLAEGGGMCAVDAGPLARAHELKADGYLHNGASGDARHGFRQRGEDPRLSSGSEPCLCPRFGASWT